MLVSNKTAKTYKRPVNKARASLASRKRKPKKFNSEFCTASMTYEECQLAILNHYINKNDAINKLENKEFRNIDQMTEVIEAFLRKHKLICYGGTAINNILPKHARFYDRQIDTPDYDCYSTDPIEHAKELVDMYVEAGFMNVEAKAGVHMGTIKVIVDFVNMADLTLLHPTIYREMKRDAIHVDGLVYASANVLRMNAYTEISAPRGYVERWGKVFTRLELLNHYFPLVANKCKQKAAKQFPPLVHKTVLETLVDQSVVFIGGYAISQYEKYIKKKKFSTYGSSDFDVLSLTPEATAETVRKNLVEAGIKSVVVKEYPPLGELIPESFEVRVEGSPVATVYQPTSCHNYNAVPFEADHKKSIRIATIDTIMAFSLAFYYSGQTRYDRNYILCRAKILFDIQKKTKLLQTGILKRFNSSFLGHTKSLSEILEEKLAKRKNATAEEAKLLFFNYVRTNGKPEK